MTFTAADQTAILTATGEPVSIDGTDTIGKFKAAGKLVQLFDGSVVTTGPTVILSATDAAEITLNSTELTIRDTDYQATQRMIADGGLVEFELTTDY